MCIWNSWLQHAVYNHECIPVEMMHISIRATTNQSHINLNTIILDLMCSWQAHRSAQNRTDDGGETPSPADQLNVRWLMLHVWKKNASFIALRTPSSWGSNSRPSALGDLLYNIHTIFAFYQLLLIHWVMYSQRPHQRSNVAIYFIILL